MFMKRSHLIIFIGFFLAVIFIVPLVQAIFELRTNKKIQVFDLVIDAVVTPLERAQKMNALAGHLSDCAAYFEKTLALDLAPEVGAKTDTLEKILDDASSTAADLKKTALTINRHVSRDSSDKEIKTITSCARILDTLGSMLRAGPALEDLREKTAMLTPLVDSMTHRYSKPTVFSGIIVSAVNLRNIFWDARYLRPYEKEMENASIFAQGTRPAMHFLRYTLFRDLGEKAIAGKESWFFYKPDVQYLSKPYISDPRNFADPTSNVVDPNLLKSNDEPIQKIVTFQNQLKELSIDLLVVIIPGKPSIYPDMLGACDIPASCAGDISPSLRFINELRENGVEVVDLFGPFARERNNDQAAGDSLYLHKDTHWKARALRLASRCVAKRIKQYPWFVPGTADFELDSVTVNREGDVGVMTTLPAYKVGELGFSFPAEPTQCFQVFSVSRDATGAETTRTLYKDDFANSRILVLGDSFSRIYQTDEPRGAGWIAHLAYELKQPVASIVSDGGASTLVRESLARRSGVLKGKKLVVWEFVERDIRFGAEGWKDVKIKL
jgi:hypothetical protein